MKVSRPAHRFLKLVLALLLGLSVVGCNLSFQSTQYQFLKSLALNESTVEIPTWVAIWDGKERLVYPVALENETLFTDGDALIVSFDGWNITKIRGLPNLGVLERFVQSKEGKETVFRNHVDQEKVILEGQRTIAWNSSLGRRSVWYCGGWFNRADGLPGYVQTCFVDDPKRGGANKFVNTIGLTSSGMIQSMGTTFDPNKGELRIELR